MSTHSLQGEQASENNQMVKILHFADAHIDMANYGRHDPETGLPFRVLDFLKSLDTIVDTAISEKVDLVLFAGDAYKDRTPAPTYQREWDTRIARLSHAGIPTLLLIGNHDISPSVGRANAIQELDTLGVPHVRVIARPASLGPAELEGLPLHVLGLPWVSRSGLMAALDLQAGDPAEVYAELGARLAELVNHWIEQLDPALPVVLTAHASVEGASYGGERSVMLGGDLVLPGALVKDPRLDYVALGHVHKPQDLNPGAHPPVIYPGSIERVDFGEAREDRFFVIAHVERGQAQVEWRQLKGVRPFVDRRTILIDPQGISQALLAALPPADEVDGAIVRLTVEYPREWETLIDEKALREYTARAFEFHLVKRPIIETRIRLPQDQAISALTPLDLLEKYWEATHADPDELTELRHLAEEVIHKKGIDL